MRILALMGSPRKGGNTDILTEEMLGEARAQGHFTENLHLCEYDLSALR